MTLVTATTAEKRPTRRIYLDTEFVQGDKTLELISVGAVDDEGRTYYAINKQMNLTEVSDWVVENVICQLERSPYLWKSESVITYDLMSFFGFGNYSEFEEEPEYSFRRKGRPEIWGWYTAYDWYIISRLFGTFDQLPKHFPNRMHCLRQWMDDVEFEANYGKCRHPKPHNNHNALADAIWVKEYHEKLLERKSDQERWFEEQCR